MILGTCLGLGILLNSFVTLLEALSLTNEGLEEVLNAHNNIRRDFANGRYGGTVANMGKLRWNSYLASRAEELIDCINVEDGHNPDFSEDQINQGFSRSHNLTMAVQQWFLEITHYIPEYGTCLTTDICRHFLMMINAKHHSIGCASLPNCSAGTALLCVYRGGEFIPPFVAPGSPCKKCERPSAFCEDGLCVPCASTRHSECDCRKTCRRPNIGYGDLDAHTCTCHCQYGMGPNCDEDCVNPEQYLDFDICADVTQAECHSFMDRDKLREFCPEQCVCRKHPGSPSMSGGTH
ncbi:hypothetical protein ScPMuIL_001306 [Solemya velum]